MPELPEVESVAIGLNKIIPNIAEVGQVQQNCKMLRFPIPKKLLQDLPHAYLVKVYRRAKYLIFDFKSFAMLSHLGMTGSWRLETQANFIQQKHDHFIIPFNLNKKYFGSLVYNDPRRFGYLDYIDLQQGNKKANENAFLQELGPEPILTQNTWLPNATTAPATVVIDHKKEAANTTFTAEYLFQKSRNRKTPVKTFIMNQAIVVGVGNIYASESLFRAGIHPQKMAIRLTATDADRLVQAIQQILLLAIKSGGSSIRDYKNAEGQSGGFQKLFQVYGREQQPCIRCGTLIRQITQSGRSTFFCPNCQKK